MEFRIQGQEFIDHVNVHTASVPVHMSTCMCVSHQISRREHASNSNQTSQQHYPSVINVVLINADHVTCMLNVILAGGLCMDSMKCATEPRKKVQSLRM